jgi:hypothetical protein
MSDKIDDRWREKYYDKVEELIKVEKEYDNLSIKLQRTVSAAASALLEMSAWMGIPEKKRANQIEDLMSNVKFCAEHDLRYVDESQTINILKSTLETENKKVMELMVTIGDQINQVEAANKVILEFELWDPYPDLSGHKYYNAFYHLRKVYNDYLDKYIYPIKYGNK